MGGLCKNAFVLYLRKKIIKLKNHKIIFIKSLLPILAAVIVVAITASEMTQFKRLKTFIISLKTTQNCQLNNKKKLKLKPKLK